MLSLYSLRDCLREGIVEVNKLLPRRYRAYGASLNLYLRFVEGYKRISREKKELLPKRIHEFYDDINYLYDLELTSPNPRDFKDDPVFQKYSNRVLGIQEKGPNSMLPAICLIRKKRKNIVKHHKRINTIMKGEE